MVRAGKESREHVRDSGSVEGGHDAGEERGRIAHGAGSLGQTFAAVSAP